MAEAAVVPADAATEPAAASHRGSVLGAMQPRLDQDQFMTTMRQAGPPPPKQYQFDPAMALQLTAAVALAGLIWFARRRLIWLSAVAYAEMRRFMRWLHMPPDDGI